MNPGRDRGQQGPRRLPPGPKASESTCLPRGSVASGSNLAPSDHGPHRLLPLALLEEFEKKTLTSTAHFHGVVRNEWGVFMVFNADRTSLLRIPRPDNSYHSYPALYKTSWVSVRRVHLACCPRYPMFDGDLLGVLDVSMRSLPTKRQESVDGPSWVLAPAIANKWISLEGFLSRVVTVLRYHVGRLVPAVSCGTMHPRPITYGYTNSFSSEDELISAVSHSRDAFTPLLAAIALCFLALDGSPQCANWRSSVMRNLDIQHRLMDSLEDVVERLLRHPAGMILDCTIESPRELDWLFLLLVNDTVHIHVPLYFFLGEGEQAVQRATHLESFQSMRNIRLDVQNSIRTLISLPSLPVATEEFVFVQSTMRQFGTFPNPEYYAALETKKRQFPPVEPHSGQKAGQIYTDFFACCKARNERKLAEETIEQRQTRLQREQNAKSQNCPGKKGARVFKWEKINDFWVRRLVQRNLVEEEWCDFAPSQRVYNSFANEWDLCAPLDPKAQVEYDDDDDSNDDPFGYYSSRANFAADFDDQLPTGLSDEVQSTLNNASAVLHHLDAYYDDDDDDDEKPTITNMDDIPAQNAVRAILEYRVGLVDHTERHFADTEMIKPRVSAHFLGNGTSSTPKPPSDAALALLQALSKAKRVRDLPNDLFDLGNDKIADDIWSNSGVRVTLLQGVSAQAHRSTGYVLKPRNQAAPGRQVLIFSAASVMHLVRCRCQTWGEIISHLYHLGSPFHVVVEDSIFGPSSHQPDLYQCRSLGVRPESYIPEQQDLRTYWDSVKRFLLSPRGRLALQAGGVVARLARKVIVDSELELRSDDVNIETAEELVRSGDTAVYYHALMQEEMDLVLGVYSVEMNQLDPTARNGHQEKRVSWWPQSAAFFTSGMSVGWWTPDCERWFQGILQEMAQGRAVVLNNTRWKERIRGYSAAWRLSKNLDAVCADFLTNI
ncbi:unnamed protein product [Mycena citricolor]|uniref:Uncharacterized protein n=1 Tax=Mycena citricolor TaxID=2018698 RepID=A0AAD2GZU0_9AGAR|nr:unnamed protein product [Mycena citricolor]